MHDGSYIVLIVGFAAHDRGLVEYLGKHYEVIEVADQREADAALESNQVDLVLCRHSPDVVDAIPFLRQVRDQMPGLAPWVDYCYARSSRQGAPRAGRQRHEEDVAQ